MLKRRFSILFFSFIFLAASAQTVPPTEKEDFRTPDLVELIKLDPALRLDIRYAGKHNFVGQAVYEEARAFLQRPAAEALIRAHRKANQHGYGFIIFDAYRPWSVTKRFWDHFPKDRAYLADPAKGSRHNRGCAVDLSLYDLRTGQLVPMPSEFDDFTEKAHPGYTGGTAAKRKARDQLRFWMESEGFSVYENEWWHFDFKAWREYPIMNVPFRHIH